MTPRSNKLISLLGSLDRAQIRACRKLVQSPWFGGNDDLLALYDELTTRLVKGRKAEKKDVWASIFGDSRPYNDVRLRKYTSNLFKLVKEYLIQETLAGEDDLRRYLYLAALEKQHPEKLVRGVERNWPHLQRGNIFDANTFLFEHLLELRKYTLLNYDHRPFARSNMEEVSESLDKYFIINKLYNAVNTGSQSKARQHSYELKLTEDVVQFLERDPTYLGDPAVALHYYMYKMLAAPDADHGMYYNYKAKLLEFSDRLSERRGYLFFQPPLNYCSRRINEGDQTFLGEYMELYKYALDRNSVFDEGVLDPLQFRSTILIALRNGEYGWTERYIEQHQDKLPPKQRQNAVNYNSATLYFYQKDYDKALEFLRDVEYENKTINLNAKSMLLAIYYETGANDALDSLFDSITTYLNRHKELPESMNKAFGNLANFTLRLNRLLPGDQRALTALKTDLEEQQIVASRPWLLEKIAALE